MTNSILSKLYNRYMVHADDKYTYPNIHILSISLPHCFYKVNIFFDIIILDLPIIFQTYDFISCDISYDCSFIVQEKKRKKKRKLN